MRAVASGAANLLGADFSPHGAGTRQTHFQGGRDLRTFFKLGGGLAVGGCLFLFVSKTAVDEIAQQQLLLPRPYCVTRTAA